MKSTTARKLNRISGYLEPGDAAMVSTLLLAQAKAGIGGSVAEIGVHHGKLILRMGTDLQGNERAVAIDIFDEQQDNIDRSGKGDLAIFKRHVADLGLDDRLDIIQGNSTRLASDDLLRLSKTPFRMFSVDGGHSYDVVSSDMALAAATLCEGGIILADDYFNYGWPDVSYAVSRFVQSDDNAMIPFAASSSKLYLTNSPDMASYYQAMLERSGYPSLEKNQKMGSSDVYVFDTRSVGSTAFTFVRILKGRLRGWRASEIAA